eukprot:2557813-Rhodomonas_salina.2
MPQSTSAGATALLVLSARSASRHTPHKNKLQVTTRIHMQARHTPGAHCGFLQLELGSHLNLVEPLRSMSGDHGRVSVPTILHCATTQLRQPPCQDDTSRSPDLARPDRTRHGKSERGGQQESEDRTVRLAVACSRKHARLHQSDGSRHGAASASQGTHAATSRARTRCPST